MVIAVILATAGIFAAISTLMVQAMAKNHDKDTYLAWRRSLGRPLFTLGYGRRSLQVQARVAIFVTLALFAASGFFALRALFAE